jgi:hypothetical protein
LGLLATNRSLDQTVFTQVRPHDLGFDQATVTVLSIMCPCTRLQCGQVKIRKSWPNAPGSIAVSFIGEPQAVHCGPWFCESSMASPQFGALSSPASQPAAFDLKGSDAVTLIST